jgi:hypothetical protein
MSKLDEKTKQELAEESVMSILRVSKLHNIDFKRYPQGTRNYILDIYTAGMCDMVKAVRDYEKDKD